jgi:hypothetical protein
LGFFAGFVGFVAGSSSFDSELVLAPPVLTTTLVGASDAVDSGDGDAVVSEPFGCSAAVESEVVVDADSEDDSPDAPDVSAHACPHPYPVATATPTPSATANPPTRPTYTDERIVFVYASNHRRRGFLRKTADRPAAAVQSRLQPDSKRRYA